LNGIVIHSKANEKINFIDGNHVCLTTAGCVDYDIRLVLEIVSSTHAPIGTRKKLMLAIQCKNRDVQKTAKINKVAETFEVEEENWNDCYFAPVAIISQPLSENFDNSHPKGSFIDTRAMLYFAPTFEHLLLPDDKLIELQTDLENDMKETHKQLTEIAQKEVNDR
jgi:hypothetical protein